MTDTYATSAAGTRPEHGAPRQGQRPGKGLDEWSGAPRGGGFSSARRRMALGGGLLAFGLTRRSKLGRLSTLVPGGVLLAAGYAARQQAHGLRMSEEVVIDASPEQVYDVLRDFGRQPRYMTHLHQVMEAPDGTIHWVMEVAGGVRMEWDGRLTEQDRPNKLAWTSLPGTPFDEIGVITISPEPDGRRTRVHAHMSYFFRGKIAAAAMAAFEPLTRDLLAAELGELKRMIEAGEATGGHMPRQAWQPSGTGPVEYAPGQSRKEIPIETTPRQGM